MVGSHSSRSTCNNFFWIQRSMTVGTPSVRVPPDAFGISTFRTACSVQVPAKSCALTSSPWLRRCYPNFLYRHPIHSRASSAALHSFQGALQFAGTYHRLHRRPPRGCWKFRLRPRHTRCGPSTMVLLGFTRLICSTTKLFAVDDKTFYGCRFPRVSW